MPGERDVRDFGAAGNGIDDDTAALQDAIDAAAGGGRLLVARGTYRSATLHLRSGLVLDLAPGATLLMDSDSRRFDAQQYPPYETHADHETSDFAHALLAAHGALDVRITGAGTIDGNRARRFGPKPIALFRCHDVVIEGVTVLRAPNYAISLGGCDDVLVRGVTIREAHCDGIDPDSCARVTIVDCDVQSDDDAVCLKSSLILGVPTPCEDVEVAGCRLRSGANAWKIGTETSGPVRRVHVHDCTLDGRIRAERDEEWSRLIGVDEGGGISIETVDGADVTDVLVERCTVTHTYAPVFVRRGARGRGQDVARPGVLTGVVLRDIDASDSRGTASITGVPGFAVGDVRLERVRVDARGGLTGDELPPGPVPEQEAEYPAGTMFGTLPASVLYARHVESLPLDDVMLTTTAPDVRPELVVDDDVVHRRA
jgi:polygalacturonase